MVNKDLPFIPLAVFSVITGRKLVRPVVIREKFNTRRKERTLPALIIQIPVFETVLTLIVSNELETRISRIHIMGVPIVPDIRVNKETISQTQLGIGYQITETSFTGRLIKPSRRINITIDKVDDPRPLAFAGVIYVKNQRWEDAAHHLNRALGRTPKDPCLQTALAIAELHTAGAETALKRLQAVVKQFPDYTPALFNIASIHRYWQKNQPEAKRWFELYLSKTSETDPFAAQARAQLQSIAEGNSGEKLTFTPPRNPNRINADKNFEKALAYQKKNDFDTAIRWYIKAVEEDDTYEQAFYNLGLSYYAANRMELASDAFARAVQLNPTFVGARYNSALAEYRLGHNDRALRELEIVLKQQPNYKPAIDLKTRLRK